MDKKDDSNKKYLIGITGQTGAGKTLVATIMADHGFSKIEADAVSNEVTGSEPCLSSLVSYFGNEILNEDKTLSKKKLAKIVFNDKNELNKLNKISHPFIVKKTLEIVGNINNNLIVLDAATLIESGLFEKCDFIVVVTAPLDVRINRIIKRDNVTLVEANERVAAQHNEFFYTEKANIVINNISKTYPNLETKAIHLVNYIKNKFIVKMWDFN